MLCEARYCRALGLGSKPCEGRGGCRCVLNWPLLICLLFPGYFSSWLTSLYVLHIILHVDQHDNTNILVTMSLWNFNILASTGVGTQNLSKCKLSLLGDVLRLGTFGGSTSALTLNISNILFDSSSRNSARVSLWNVMKQQISPQQWYRCV